LIRACEKEIMGEETYFCIFMEVGKGEVVMLGRFIPKGPHKIML
jgi:hypothetical protein